MRTSSRWRSIALLAALGTAAVACSDDGDDEGGGGAAIAPTTTNPAPTTSAAPATTASSATTTVAPDDGGLDLGANVPPAVASAIEGVVSKGTYAHSTWGVMVRDKQSGDVLVDLNGDSMFVTGSILKTLSAAGVLEAYGPDRRFVTPVYRTGPVEGGVLQGNLVLVASGGDFSFGLRDQSDGTLSYTNLPDVDHNEANSELPGVVVPPGNPSAALDALSAQVAAAGVTSIDGDVVIDDRFFQAYEGWPDGIIAPIWFNENVVDITITPGAAGGDTATVDWKPQTAAYTVQSNVTTIASGGTTEPLAATLASPGVISVTGTVEQGADPSVRIYKVEDPSAWARTAFIESLQRAGITVTASPTGANPAELLPAGAYDEASKLGEHTSATLAELVKVILKVSYNRGADLLVCLTAASSGSTQCPDGILPTTQTIATLGIEDGTTFMFDGAGSDERDRATPGAMTEFLRGASEASWGAAFEDGLPILGVDGTLATNQAGTAAAGKVFAKTGTRVAVTDAGQGLVTGLTQVGYVDAASGRRLTYAVMVRDVPIAQVEDFFAIDADQGTIAAAIQADF